MLSNDIDPEGNTLTVTHLNGSAIAIGVPTSIASGAAVTLDADGSFTYNPGTAFDSLPAGWTTSDSFSYTISDGNGGTETGFVSVVITGTNDAPIAVNDAASFSSAVLSQTPVGYWRLGESSGTTAANLGSLGTAGTYAGPTLGVASAVVGDTAVNFDGVNDHVNLGTFDVDGSGLTMAAWFNADDFDTSDQRIISKALSTGANAEQDHWWMLSTVQSGSDYVLRFRLKAGGTTDTLIASSGALSANQWYFAAATYDETSGLMQLFLNGTLVGSQTHAVGGAVSMDPTQTVMIGANPNGYGHFDGRIDEVAVFNNAISQSQLQMMYDSSAGVYSVDEDDTLSVSAAQGVLANDSDAESSPLTAVLVTGPANASSFTLNSDGSFAYTPNADFSGTDTFTYQANDGTENSNLATVTINIAAINDAPVMTTGSTSDLTVSEDSGLTSLGLGGLMFSPGGGADESSQSLTYQVTTIPSSAFFGDIVLADGTTVVTTTTYSLAQIQGMQLRTTANISGSSAFGFQIIDSGGTAYGGEDTSSVFMLLTITPVNDTPVVAINTGATFAEGSSVIITNAMLNEGDPDDAGSGVIYRLRFDLVGGALLLNGTALTRDDSFTQADIDAGLVVYQHLGGEDPTEVIRLQMSDGGEDGATTLNVDFDLTITPVNDAPVSAHDPAGEDVDLTTDVAAVGFWRLGETVGSTATDATSNNHDGTYNSVTLGANGATGDGNTAADFNGSNSYVNLGTLDINGSGLTLSAWIQPDSFATGDARIISKADGIDAVDHTFMLSTVQVGSDYFLRLRISAGGHTDTLIANTGALAIASWQHVVATYDSGTGQMSLYLNGQLLEQGIHSVGGPLDQDPTRSVWIGANPDGSKYFDGKIDEVALMSRALSANEVAFISTLSPADYSVLEDNALTVSAANGVLHNDSDTDGDTLNAVLVSGPSQAASFTLNSDGSFTYTPIAHFFGTDTFTYRADDGTTQSQLATVTITIVPVNDAPTVTSASLAAMNEDTVNSGNTLTALFGASFQDDDPGATLEGMLVVANNAPVGEGTWQYSTNGVNWHNVGSVNETTALALSDTSRLRFVPAANYNGTPTSLVLRALDDTYSQSFTIGSTRTSIDASSAGGDSPISASTVTLGTSVLPVNDAATIVNLHGDILFYSEGEGLVLLDQTTAAQVADIDSSDFQGGSLTVAVVSGGDVTEDELSIHHQGTAVGEIGISGSDVTYGGTIIGTFSGGSAGVDLVIAFNANATPEAVTALIRNVQYENVDTVDATTTTRHVGFTINDGDGAVSNQSVVAINIGATNNPPTVSLPSGSLTYVENAPPAVLDAAATIIDGDSLDFFGGYIRASFSSGGGYQDQLSIRNQGTGPGQISLSGGNVLYEGIVVGTRSGGTYGSQLNISLLATATPEAAQAIVRNLTYENISDNPNASRTITISVSDGDGGVTSEAIVVNVTPVNDAGEILSGFESYSGLFGGQTSRSDLGSANYWADSWLAIDPSGTYQLSAIAVSGDGAGNNYEPGEIHYLGFVSFDADGNTIESIHVHRHASAVDTTLAVDLIPGATQIVLNSAAGWNNSASGLAASLAWYGYQNAFGETYADYTYTRNVATDLWDAGAISGNVITLRNPWAGPTLLAGEAVRNATGTASNYQFPLLNGAAIPQIDTNYSATIGGGVISNGLSSSTLFRPGTAYISPVVLANFNDTETELAVSNFSISASLAVTVFTENGGPIPIVDSDVNLYDVDDSFTESVTITLTNGKAGDLLLVDEAAINLLGISVTGIPIAALSADGSFTLTLTSNIADSVSLADFQTALGHLSFNNLSEDPDTTDRLVTFVMNDGEDDSLPHSLFIKLQAANDAPYQANIEASVISYTENDGPVAITSTLELSDVDDTHLESATVQIIGNYASGQDVLSFIDQNGIVGVWDVANGTLTLSGSATKQDYQAALRSVTYSNTSEAPSTALRTFNFQISDGADNSLSVTRNLTVASVNDDPTNVGVLPDSLAFDEDVLSNVDLSTMTLSDLDALSGHLTVTLSTDAGGDLFASSAGGVTVVGGGSDYVTFTGTLANLNSYFDVITSVRYRHPTLDINGSFLDVIYVSVSDNGNTGAGGGANLSLGAIDVHVTPVNDAPVASSIEGAALAYIENLGAVTITSTLTISDVDDADIESAVVSISANYANGQDVLAFVDQNGIIGSWNAASGELTLSGSATVAQYQAALRSITYTNTSDDPSTSTRTISYTVNDGDIDSNTVTRHITLSSTNDAPVITGGPDTSSLTESNVGLTDSGALTVTDVDMANIVTAAVDAVVVSGTGASSVPASLTNATLRGFLAVTPTTILNSTQTTNTLTWNFNSGSEAFNFLASGETLVLTYSISATDNNGTPLSDTETVTVTITGTEDAPVITGGPDTSSLTESNSGLTDSGALTVTDFDLTDTVAAAVDAVVVSGTGASSVPASLTNATLRGFLSVTPTAILDGTQTTNTLTWNFNSGSEAFNFLAAGETLVLSYTVSVTDDNGTPLSDTETITVTITGSDDAPVITGGPDTSSLTESDTGLTDSGTLTVTDLDLTDNVTAAVDAVVVSGTGARAVFRLV